MPGQVTLDQVEALVDQLSPREQLRLVVNIGNRLASWPMNAGATSDDTLQRERSGRANAVAALCGLAAEHCQAHANAAADLRQLRNDRIDQVCRNDA